MDEARRRRAADHASHARVAVHPIEQYGVIGDLATVALVSMSGSIDFLCYPRFDSPTVFAALLDPGGGGTFRIAPDLPDARRKQIYLPDTNILLTRFLSPSGLVELMDVMPIADGSPEQRIVRHVKSVRGDSTIRLLCAPRFNYARSPHRLEINGSEALFSPDGGEEPLRLFGTQALAARNGDAVAEFVLKSGDSAVFVLERQDGGPSSQTIHAYAERAFAATSAFWQAWVARSTYNGRWREIVTRSALVLKLLTSQTYGSLVAAPTFGLPEDLGGMRNWDYRYTWIRDASFALRALIRLGYTDEAAAFMRWIDQRCTEPEFDGRMQIMYGIDGRHDLTEHELDHFAGYADSKPVRIGNAAHNQLQLDIYGALMDAVYLANKYGEATSHDSWMSLTRTLEWLSGNWRQPDEGIWEVRGGTRDFLHSRVMCWVAFDRALRLARKRSLPTPLGHWVRVRNDIHRDIFENFWDPERQAFVQHLGATTLDAAALMMPLVKLIAPTDPRWTSTLKAIGEELATDALVRRYDTQKVDFEGLHGSEGSFTPCSFWYVENLALAGRVAEARLMFEKMLGYANHLGLFSEELGLSGEHLGNYPQALTHLTLISAACTLDRELSGDKRSSWSR